MYPKLFLPWPSGRFPKKGVGTIVQSNEKTEEKIGQKITDLHRENFTPGVSILYKKYTPNWFPLMLSLEG